MGWSFFYLVRFFILLTVFELLPKTCNFTICSIFSNSGHVGWCTASRDTILKLDTLVMIQTKFGFHWSSTFRWEIFWKSLRRTTDDDDGHQVMAIAHLTLWVRWAKNDVANDRVGWIIWYIMRVSDCTWGTLKWLQVRVVRQAPPGNIFTTIASLIFPMTMKILLSNFKM